MLTFYKLILRESSKRGRPDTLTGTSPMESSKRVSKEQVILQNIAYLRGLEGSVSTHLPIASVGLSRPSPSTEGLRYSTATCSAAPSAMFFESWTPSPRGGLRFLSSKMTTPAAAAVTTTPTKM